MSEVIRIPLKPSNVKQTIQLQKDLNPMALDRIIQLLGWYKDMSHPILLEHQRELLK